MANNSRIASLRMPKNKTVSGSIYKICGGGVADKATTLAEISYGVPILNPTPGANTGGAITSSHGSPWVADTTAYDIITGACLDGTGIAAFKTANTDDDLPIVYYYKGVFDGPNAV